MIGIKNFFIFAGFRHTGCNGSSDTRKIRYHKKEIIFVPALSQKSKIALFGSDMIDPLKTFRFVVKFVQCRRLSIQQVQIADKLCDTLMLFDISEVPFNTTTLIPLILLA